MEGRWEQGNGDKGVGNEGRGIGDKELGTENRDGQN